MAKTNRSAETTSDHQRQRVPRPGHLVRRNGVSYPVALDPEYSTWKAYASHYWPALYLIDRQGRVVYRHVGEGAYAQTEARIQTLLAESGANLAPR